MNKFIGLTIKLVVAATLIGSATACANFPLLGRNRATNQVQNSPQTTGTQPVSQAPLRSGQPAAQAPQTTQGQGGTVTADPAQSDPNQPVPALW